MIDLIQIIKNYTSYLPSILHFNDFTGCYVTDIQVNEHLIIRESDKLQFLMDKCVAYFDPIHAHGKICGDDGYACIQLDGYNLELDWNCT